MSDRYLHKVEAAEELYTRHLQVLYVRIPDGDPFVFANAAIIINGVKLLLHNHLLKIPAPTGYNTVCRLHNGFSLNEKGSRFIVNLTHEDHFHGDVTTKRNGTQITTISARGFLEESEAYIKSAFQAIKSDPEYLEFAGRHLEQQPLIA